MKHADNNVQDKQVQGIENDTSSLVNWCWGVASVATQTSFHSQTLVDECSEKHEHIIHDHHVPSEICIVTSDEEESQHPDILPSFWNARVRVTRLNSIIMRDDDHPELPLCASMPTWSKQQAPVVLENMNLLLPTDRDVICAKGTNKDSHNKLYLELCHQYATEYATTKRRGLAGKKGLAMKIVKAMKNAGGRFLKLQDDGDDNNTDKKQYGRQKPESWQLLTNDEAAEKAAHCMRDIYYREQQKKDIKEP